MPNGQQLSNKHHSEIQNSSLIYLFEIFYRGFEVDDITNAGHDCGTGDCVPEIQIPKKYI